MSAAATMTPADPVARRRQRQWLRRRRDIARSLELVTNRLIRMSRAHLAERDWALLYAGVLCDSLSDHVRGDVSESKRRDLLTYALKLHDLTKTQSAPPPANVIYLAAERAKRR